MSKDIVLLINRSEITAGTRGASLGPDAIITAARKNQKSFLVNQQIEEIKDVNYLLDQPTEHTYAKRIDGLLTIYNSLNEKVSTLLSNNKFPLLLAADHGSAGGTIAGIKSAFPDKRLGVVWIDAHADIHTPYTTPSGNMHGMPLATALNEDNLPSKINELSAETSKLWEEIKHVGGIAPKINAEDIVYIAVRDTEDQENDIMNRLQIRNYSVDELRSKGVATVINEIETKLSNCDIIYVSFDVDSMDPDLTSHGTGTPVKNGITPEEANAVLNSFAKNPKTVCMELVEVNPCLDEKINEMAEVSMNIIESVMNSLKN
ncbi:arginase [Flavobacterium urocaniciphilum]|uniref:Arginase n=1 Tax=Flavobacterium urocaniciphilum TaxID=1299341 RepID=A0A1H8YTN6_9FLAO|nr:arginase [Flavobacterium urocaniciphilum]SEP54718.1 arginase [Flavobacterium urocaniciphilum]